MKSGKRLIKTSEVKVLSDVPSWKRFVAYMLDWYLGSIFTSLPMVMIYMKVTNTDNLNVNLFQYPKQYAMLAGGLGLLFALFYYMIVPLCIWKGQTLGKRWCHFKIAKRDGDDVCLKELFLRQIIGIFLIEGALIFPSDLFHQILSLVSNINFVTPLTYIGIVVSVLSAIFVIFRKDHKAIHDLISNTKVMSV
ncbi:RDD family protein [Clostridium algidicarnis]|uniref:RDD family protein n=1 Tax=Clostridium algidicarnis TaxID=37659 RepID=UPI000497C1C3|nr:RDD family protein [Clostridium algidicarnis]